MKKLEMIFKNELGSKTKITVENAKDDLTKEKVEAAMNAIITADIFETSNGKLVGIDSARVVTTDIEDIVA